MLVTGFMVVGGVLGMVGASLIFNPHKPGPGRGWRIAFGILCAAIGMLAGLFAAGRVPIAWADEITHVNSEQRFDELLEASYDKPILVEFYANWCTPCRESSSQLNTLVREGVSVAVVNIDEQPELAESYEIEGVPTLLILYEGEVQEGVIGSMTEGEMRELLDGVLKNSA